MKAINRHQTVDQVISSTKAARSIGYSSVNFDIIYGLPFQREEHIKNTIGLIQELRPERIAFYSYAHVPWKSKGQRAFSIADISMGIDKHRLKELGHELLLDAGYIPIGMDHYALQEDMLSKAADEGLLHRNFMGYTDHKPNVLLGLGCSAISETNDMYVQNIKAVEAYEEKIKSGHMALLKGHNLSVSEQIVKKHISNLFCQGITTWTEDSEDYKLLNSQLDELKELAEDGLLQILPMGLKVTEKPGSQS